MPRTRKYVKFSKTDKTALKQTLAKKQTSAREQTHARILDLLFRQESPEQIAELLGISLGTVYNTQNRFLEEGLQAALSERPRSGKPPVIKPEERAKITALACSDAPAGHARWTLRLLADKVVELGYVESISHMEVSRILKKMNFSLTAINSGASER